MGFGTVDDSDLPKIRQNRRMAADSLPAVVNLCGLFEFWSLDVESVKAGMPSSDISEDGIFRNQPEYIAKTVPAPEYPAAAPQRLFLSKLH